MRRARSIVAILIADSAVTNMQLTRGDYSTVYYTDCCAMRAMIDADNTRLNGDCYAPQSEFASRFELTRKSELMFGKTLEKELLEEERRGTTPPE